MPEAIEDGVLYISIEYATAIHKCCCGCGSEVVTPLSPTDWELTFDGQSVSLYPSIGNWSFPCQSHYWIAHDNVKWAPRLSKAQIRAGRARELRDKQEYFRKVPSSLNGAEDTHNEQETGQRLGFWERLKTWWNT